jgi:ketopantoate reductase
VVGAYLTFGGFVEGPGRVRYAGEGSFRLGELDGTKSARVQALAAAFGALQPCAVTDNIFGYLWAKMVLGAVYYGTAVLDRDVPEIYADARARTVLGRAAREAAEVARANGVRLEECDGFDPAAFADGDAAGIAASWEAQRAYWAAHVGSARTGIWRDLAVHHRKTECSEHVGAVIRRRGAVATPTLDRIAACVAGIEAGERRLGWHNLEWIAGEG